MRYKLFFYLVFINLLMVACKTDQPKTKDTEKPASLTFKETIFSKKYGTCLDTAFTGNCVKIEFVYPVAQGTAQSTLINDAVSEVLKSTMLYETTEATKSLTLDQIADTVITAYQQMKADMGDYSMDYQFEVTGKVLMQNQALVSIELPAYTFTGGAHPNSYTTLLNFDLSTQQLLTLNDFIADTTALKRIGETAFFEARKDGGVAKDDFFWDSGYFLPANMALTDKGLYFYYNPYEAAAYVFGPTDYTLPYDQLKEILKPNYLPK